MRVETNLNLVRRNRRIAQWLFFLSFGILLAGLFIINTPPASEETAGLSFLLSLAVLPVALIATMASVRMTNLWVRPPRPESAIEAGLKGITYKTVLYNYFHGPAKHVLITPQGVFAIVTRYQSGRFKVEGETWTVYKNPISRIFTFIRMDQIGNPADEARRAAAHVQSLITPITPNVVVEPLILFTDSRVQLEVIQPTVPVLHADPKRPLSLKEYLKARPKNAVTLKSEQIKAFDVRTFGEDTAAESTTT